jgi:hypothetical protein
VIKNIHKINKREIHLMAAAEAAAAEAAAVVPEKEPTPTACKRVHRTIFFRRKSTSVIF